jgi:hypothetical protein
MSIPIDVETHPCGKVSSLYSEKDTKLETYNYTNIDIEIG